MLEIRPNCECCDKDLPPGSKEAMICTFCNWRFKTDESKKILEGCRRDGYLHYLEKKDAAIPALLFYIW